MLIAVISDTHRMKNYIDKAKKYLKEASIIIHLGDNIEDIECLKEGFKGDVYAVKGNCDLKNTFPTEQVIDIEGIRIFMTHGHNYGVKMSLNNLYYKAKEINADIVLFGHTHEHLIVEEDGITFMNPGSISLPRSMGRYIGFIDISSGEIKDIYLKEVK